MAAIQEPYAPTSGAEVPLSAFTTYQMTNTSLAVNHLGQFPMVNISFNLPAGTSLGDAVAAIQAATAKMHLPASIQGSFLGTAQAFQASLANQPFLIMAALLSVYIVLGILYESYVHPITILSTLPLGRCGRAPRPYGHRHRLEHHRPHRHHPAYRHRQEERHHDDRLRPGGRARRG